MDGLCTIVFVGAGSAFAVSLAVGAAASRAAGVAAGSECGGDEIGLARCAAGKLMGRGLCLALATSGLKAAAGLDQEIGIIADARRVRFVVFALATGRRKPQTRWPSLGLVTAARRREDWRRARGKQFALRGLALAGNVVFEQRQAVDDLF